MDTPDEPPPGTVLLGYEANTFYPPACGSRIADWMFFNYSPASDEEGLQLRAYHERLNKWGLFESPRDAERYLKAYLSFLLPPDWDERLCNYYITEVWSAEEY
jgi:hypothetical protein